MYVYIALLQNETRDYAKQSILNSSPRRGVSAHSFGLICTNNVETSFSNRGYILESFGTLKTSVALLRSSGRMIQSERKKKTFIAFHKIVYDYKLYIRTLQYCCSGGLRSVKKYTNIFLTTNRWP